MKRRALLILTMLALVWQGMAAAAMVPGLPVSSAAVEMPEHCRMSMSQGDHAAPKPAAEVPTKDCCDAGPCACLAACGGLAVPMQFAAVEFAVCQLLRIATIPGGITAAPPPYSFRPPISLAI